MYYAHSSDGPQTEWQPLRQHCISVSQLASLSAKKFNAETIGAIAGLLHDLGKYTAKFQDRLQGSTQRVDHSTAGAREAVKLDPAIGRLIAYVVAGHHAGLANSVELAERLHNDRKIPQPDIGAFQADIPEIPTPQAFPLSADHSRRGLVVSLFTRMLFSCLVDADHTDAATWNQPQSNSQLPDQGAILREMLCKLNTHLDTFSTASKTKVNQIRRKVLAECRNASQKPRGLFSLTVPTGGGKTLSSLAFALEHAVQHGMDRVIYAIPYTSIIEQNAKVYRDIFGTEAVLEHHSNVAKPQNNENHLETSNETKKTTETWDKPLIATTNVQLFESLFSCRPSQCRKLHNIVNSVIVLDEAQMLPVDLLLPTLATIEELVRNYGCTVVLCTATQPAIGEFLGKASQDITEIISEPITLCEQLKRVEIEILDEPLSEDDLAQRILQHEQCLCIVNSRKQARELYECIAPAGDAWHLSTWMYPNHRSRVIEEVKQALQQGRPCRLISTSLIECGVNIDFPVVYRAMAGLDSIAQAAGRCNREGKLDGLGKVVVFQPASHVGRGRINRACSAMHAVLSSSHDPMSLPAMKQFFEQFYQIESGDKMKLGKTLMDDIELGVRNLEFDFRKIDEAYSMIEDATEIIVIPHREAVAWVQDIREHRASRETFRQLQRYGAQVYRNEIPKLLASGVIEELQPTGFLVLTNDSLYNKDTGLVLTNPTHIETDKTIL